MKSSIPPSRTSPPTEAALPDIGVAADLQANQFDHLRDLRKHETV